MKDPSSRCRSMAKALSWRTLSIIMTSALVWAVTGSIHLGAAIGGIDFMVKFAVFYWHERIWHQIKWGKQHVAEDLSEMQ
jgi:uncharacterized membrane protein